MHATNDKDDRHNIRTQQKGKQAIYNEGNTFKATKSKNDDQTTKH